MANIDNVIKRLTVRIQSDSEEWDTVELPIGEAEEILALLKEQPQWINVKDRLPPDDEMVIGYTPVDGYMFVGFHKTYRYSWQDTAVCYWYILTARHSTRKMTKRVTHWMPLPEPPKGLKQND